MPRKAEGDVCMSPWFQTGRTHRAGLPNLITLLAYSSRLLSIVYGIMSMNERRIRRRKHRDAHRRPLFCGCKGTATFRNSQILKQLFCTFPQKNFLHIIIYNARAIERPGSRSCKTRLAQKKVAGGGGGRRRGRKGRATPPVRQDTGAGREKQRRCSGRTSA